MTPDPGLDVQVSCSDSRYQVSASDSPDSIIRKLECLLGALKEAERAFTEYSCCCSDLSLLRQRYPTQLDRLAWRRATGYQSPPYRPVYRPTVRFLPPGRMKAREQIARGIV